MKQKLDTGSKYINFWYQRKRILSLVLCFALMIGILPKVAFAAETVVSGYCGGEGDGTNLTWTLTSEGELTISGQGAMKDYSSYCYETESYENDDENPPWDEYVFTSLTIESGITYIGRGAFDNGWELQDGLMIPDSVIKIGRRAFESCHFEGTLTLSDSLTEIEEGAFAACVFYGALEIPDSVTTIGLGAFAGCECYELWSDDCETLIEYPTLSFGSGVSSIGASAFECGSFYGALVIPDSVISIGDYAFAGCDFYPIWDDNLETILEEPTLTIGANVLTIGYCAFSGAGFVGDLRIPDSVVTIDAGAFSNCTGFDGILTIGNNVVTIGPNAFSGCKNFVGQLRIPDSVVTIGDCAFEDYQYLDNPCLFAPVLTLGNSIETIGESAFDGAWGYVVLPASLTSIGSNAFSEMDVVCFYGDAPNVYENGEYNKAFGLYTDLYYVDGTDNWTNSDNYKYDEELESYVWNNHPLTVWNPILEGIDVSWDTSPITLSYGESYYFDEASSIDSAFNDQIICSAIPLDAVHVSLVRADNEAVGIDLYHRGNINTTVFCLSSIMDYDSQSLSLLTAGNTLKGLGITNDQDSLPFMAGEYYIRMWVTDVEGNSSGELSKHVTVVGAGECDHTSIDGLDNVQTLYCKIEGDDQYHQAYADVYSGYCPGCGEFIEITVERSEEEIESDIPHDYVDGVCQTTGCGYVNSNSYSGYCGGEGDGTNLTWTLDSTGVLTIDGEGAMEDFSDFSDSPWYIRRSYIKEVLIADDVTSLDAQAFSYLDIEKISVGDGITVIEASSFKNCSKLKEVTIGDAVQSIGNSAFSDCISLTSVIIPDSVTKIDAKAFYNCTNLENVTIGNSVQTIGDSAFWECENIQKIILPDSIATLASWAFGHCANLSDVVIGYGITTIATYAFYDCDALTDVYYVGTEDEWNDVNIRSGNGCLTSANIHFNYVREDSNVLPTIENFTLNGESESVTVEVGEALTFGGTVEGNGNNLKAVSIGLQRKSNGDLGGEWHTGRGSNLDSPSFDLSAFNEPVVKAGDQFGNTTLVPGEYVVQVHAANQDGTGFTEAHVINLTIVAKAGEEIRPTVTGIQSSYTLTEGNDLNLNFTVNAGGEGLLNVVTIREPDANIQHYRKLDINAASWNISTTISNLAVGQHKLYVYATATNFNGDPTNDILAFTITVEEEECLHNDGYRYAQSSVCEYNNNSTHRINTTSTCLCNICNQTIDTLTTVNVRYEEHTASISLENGVWVCSCGYINKVTDEIVYDCHLTNKESRVKVYKSIASNGQLKNSYGEVTSADTFIVLGKQNDLCLIEYTVTVGNADKWHVNGEKGIKAGFIKSAQIAQTKEEILPPIIDETIEPEFQIYAPSAKIYDGQKAIAIYDGLTEYIGIIDINTGEVYYTGGTFIEDKLVMWEQEESLPFYFFDYSTGKLTYRSGILGPIVTSRGVSTLFLKVDGEVVDSIKIYSEPKKPEIKLKEVDTKPECCIFSLELENYSDAIEVGYINGTCSFMAGCDGNEVRCDILTQNSVYVNTLFKDDTQTFTCYGRHGYVQVYVITPYGEYFSEPIQYKSYSYNRDIEQIELELAEASLLRYLTVEAYCEIVYPITNKIIKELDDIIQNGGSTQHKFTEAVVFTTRDLLPELASIASTHIASHYLEKIQIYCAPEVIGKISDVVDKTVSIAKEPGGLITKLPEHLRDYIIDKAIDYCVDQLY